MRRGCTYRSRGKQSSRVAQTGPYDLRNDVTGTDGPSRRRSAAPRTSKTRVANDVPYHQVYYDRTVSNVMSWFPKVEKRLKMPTDEFQGPRQPARLNSRSDRFSYIRGSLRPPLAAIMNRLQSRCFVRFKRNLKRILFYWTLELYPV